MSGTDCEGRGTVRRPDILSLARCAVTIDELMREALTLSAIESLTKAEIEQLWIEEARRRSAEIDAGIVETIPADDVIAEVRARLK